MSASPRIPALMQVYSFMFGDKAALLAELVATGKVPVPSTLVIGMGMGMGLTAIRLLLDFAVFKPLATRILGFSVPRHEKGVKIPTLDAICMKSKRLSPEQVAMATKLTGLSPEQVQDYARLEQEHASKSKAIGKFKEAAWRLLVYSILVIYGLVVACEQPWFKDPYLVWEGWPAGGYDFRLELYYHFSMGVYWHLIVFQFYDTRRSDFFQMLVHHVATLFLLTFSWLVSLVRIGTLVMLAHDVSDIFMETAKLFNYAQKRYPWCHHVADGVFFMFAAVFGVSRLYIFPKYMVLNVWHTSTLSSVCRLFFCGLLSTLLILHIIWFYLILRMIYMFVVHGVEEDIRSDNDGEEPIKGVTNGNGKHIASMQARTSNHDNGKAKET